MTDISPEVTVLFWHMVILSASACMHKAESIVMQKVVQEQWFCAIKSPQLPSVASNAMQSNIDLKHQKVVVSFKVGGPQDP